MEESFLSMALHVPTVSSEHDCSVIPNALECRVISFVEFV
jgi:hypothetical protein